MSLEHQIRERSAEYVTTRISEDIRIHKFKLSNYIRLSEDNNREIFESISQCTPLTSSCESCHMDYDNFKQPTVCLCVRRKFISRFGWSVPTKDVFIQILPYIANCRFVIDIACGLGLWSKLFKNAGIQVYSLDNNSSHYSKEEFENNSWLGPKSSNSIINQDPFDYLRTTSHDNALLFASWLPMGFDLNELVKLFKGQTMIIIGEIGDGCTGEYTDEEFRLVQTIKMTQFLGIRDNCHVYRRQGLDLCYAK